MFLNKILPFIISPNINLFHTTQHKPAVARFMKKVMSGSKRSKKHKYYEDNVLPTSNSFTKDVLRKTNPENTRRLAVLNKLFMRHITDLMTTGEYATLFAGYGLEINRVKVTSDFYGVNVYWIAREGASNHVENLLQSKSSQLRHELTQLHIIGIVPKLKFIKDKEYGRILEVESRLARADYGEDHEHSELNIKLRSYLELNKSLNQPEKDKILASDDALTINNQEVPVMPQNVLGVKHSEIMDRIKKAMKKSQASHRNDNVSELKETFEYSSNPNPIQFEDMKTQREVFKKFLTERQILKNKMRKVNKNYRPDWDYLAEESEIAKEHYLNSFKLNEWDDGDYLDEDDDFINDNSTKV